MASRHGHWIAALGRQALCAATAASCCVGGVQAASLRPYRELSSGIVRLSDLFDALGDTVDRDLGPAPAPGDRIIVEAPQLAAIARDFGVAWRPISGAERAVLERGGVPMDQNLVLSALRRALLAAGAPADSDIDLPGFAPPVVPAGSAAQPDVSQVQYDAPSGRFAALLTVSAADVATIHLRLSGDVVGVARAAVLTRHVRPGAVLQAEDVRTARVRAVLLRGNTALSESAAVGMALRRDLPAGQPLTNADVSRPFLVTRNGSVRMHLDAGGLTLSAQGVALEDGGLGDHVRVQNPSSHAVVIAEVTGSGEVRVDPARAPVVVAAQ